MSSWARPGAECICLNSKWTAGRGVSLVRFLAAKWAGQLPSAGCRYVVAEVGHDRSGTHIKLRGLPFWYHVVNFRPLVRPSIEEDVALFRHHLAPTQEPVA